MANYLAPIISRPIIGQSIIGALLVFTTQCYVSTVHAVVVCLANFSKQLTVSRKQYSKLVRSFCSGCTTCLHCGNSQIKIPTYNGPKIQRHFNATASVWPNLALWQHYVLLLVSYHMKVVERMFEYRIRQQMICSLALWKVRKPLMPLLLHDKCRKISELKERSSILALWIWKKATDGVLTEVIKWAMHKPRVEGWQTQTQRIVNGSINVSR